MKGRNKFKKVIIVTGTPGVGKTAVSELLAEKLDASHIDLATVVKRERLTKGFDQRRGTLIADEDKLKKRVRKLIEQCPHRVIIDGHYAASIIPKTRVTRAFVLRCHPRRLKERMEHRGFRGTELWENLAAEILDVCLYEAVMSLGQDRVCEIDTTEKTVGAVAEEVMLVLEAKQRCRVGIVDWLEKLEQEDSLDQFLRQF